MRFRSACIALILVLSACAAQPTAYYRLPDSHFQLPQNNRPAVQIKVKLAESLDQGNLLYQTSPTMLHFAQHHQWAEDLADDLANSLANKLNRNPGRYAYVVQAEGHTMPVLTVHVDAFQGRYDGQTQISGYTTWQGTGQHGRNFNAVTPQQGDGYEAMVHSLDRSLDAIVPQIAP